MDPVRIPFAPGAGTPPPDLSGRSRSCAACRFDVPPVDVPAPREKDYLRAMAEIGPGPHRSGEIADRLGIRVQSAGPLRSGLIAKGMVYGPTHGDTAFTVPLFDAFLRRIMPDWHPPRRPLPPA